MKIQPECEICGLFYARYIHYIVLGLVSHGVELAVKSKGLPTTPADIIAAALTWFGRLQ